MAPSLASFSSLAEAPDIGLVHLLERRCDVGGRRRIAAQLLQRHQDLVGPALGAAELHLFGFGRDPLGTHEVLVDARVVAADVAQRPGDVGIARLPVGVAVEQGHLADLLVEQRGDGGIEDGVIGDDLPGGVLAGFGRTVDRLVDGVAKGCEFAVQGVHAAGHRGAVVKAAGQDFADRIHLVAGAIGLLAVFVVELGTHFRIDGGRPVQDVGGKAPLGVHIARDVADGPDDLQPALRHGNLVHGLVLCDGDIDRETAADGGKRDDGGR